MGSLVTLAVWALCAYACYNIAKSKNRNKELWTILGIVFGLFAVVAISFMSNLPPA
jgi:nitrate reductase NapE component